jgi:hypothetical protein
MMKGLFSSFLLHKSNLHRARNSFLFSVAKVCQFATRFRIWWQLLISSGKIHARLKVGCKFLPLDYLLVAFAKIAIDYFEPCLHHIIFHSFTYSGRNHSSARMCSKRITHLYFVYIVEGECPILYKIRQKAFIHLQILKKRYSVTV